MGFCRRRPASAGYLGIAVAFFVLAGSSAISFAQLPNPAPPPANAGPAIVDPLGRETPRGAAMGILKYEEREDFATAARYLQPPSGQNLDLIDIAREFRVLRHGFKGDPALLSDDPKGRVEAGLPPGEERAGVIQIGGTTVDVILVRVEDPEFGKIWLVSRETVAKIPELYSQKQAEGPTAVERIVPATLMSHHLLGMSLAQWIGWILSIPLSWVLAWLLAFLLSVPRRVWRSLRKVSFKTIWETELGLPLLCILAIVIHGILVYLLEPPLLYREYYLDRVQQMLNEHPSIESGTSRIRVADFAGAAFELELWAYGKTGDWAQFTGIRQDVILKIAEIIESAGTRLAAPTRLTYVSADVGVVDALKSGQVGAV